MFDDIRLKFYPIDSETPVTGTVNLTRCLSVETCVGILIPSAALCNSPLPIFAYDDAVELKPYLVDPNRPVSIGCLMENLRGRRIVCRWNFRPEVEPVSWISRETKHSWVRFEKWPRHAPFAQIVFGVDFPIPLYRCRTVLYDVTTGKFSPPNMYALIGKPAGIVTFERFSDMRSDAAPIKRKRSPIWKPKSASSTVDDAAAPPTAIDSDQQQSIFSYLVRK
jgi:hypothetical protein